MRRLAAKPRQSYVNKKEQTSSQEKTWNLLQIGIDLMLKKDDIDLASIVAEEMIRRNPGRRRWIWFIHGIAPEKIIQTQ
jgi:hypothetical protein